MKVRVTRDWEGFYCYQLWGKRFGIEDWSYLPGTIADTLLESKSKFEQLYGGEVEIDAEIYEEERPAET